ncbi:MAG: penicillin-binding transpeptidase domain-containing protein [Agathobacter sp.]|nr:penicillin-binding transpeptidase domain-containing protein [Agathobacter sp.]
MKSNKQITTIVYIFLGLFVSMMLYFGYFQFIESERFIDSPYNSLQDLFSQKVVRGEIKTADGVVIAQTNVAEDGTETREYPYGGMFAHVVGYTSNGKMGLESTSNFDLLRSHEFFINKIVNDIIGEKNIGDNVVTTLDFDLQQVAYEAIGYYDGAIIVLEPSTGKILAMISQPAFNPNTIEEDWDTISGEDSSALFNRATQGKYAPGSTFKIFTTLEYYREHKDDYLNYSFDCTSAYSYDGSTIHCYDNKSHGTEDLMQSFANSCNASYAYIGTIIDKDKLDSLCDSLLFNKEIPVNFESGVSKFSLSNEDSVSLAMETCIGQGKTMVSPLHMAMIAGTICNDGVCMKPYIVDHTENLNGITVETTKPSEYGTLLAADEVALLQELMRGVVTEGTATYLNSSEYEVYGKTGTAQRSTTTDEVNSWFVGYAKKDGYEDIAIAVVIEQSESSYGMAVPTARKVFDCYFQ